MAATSGGDDIPHPQLTRRSPFVPRILLCLMIIAAPVTARAQAPVPVQVEYVQNSEEYATLTRMVYRDAIREVTRSARTA